MDNKEKVILQALMGLDIGGAETHVVELCLELKSRGYRVIVAANGGMYESILRKNGIEVVNVPLHTKNPIAVFKSIRILTKLIKSEKIKLVHAHARIPAFILSLLQNSLGFVMITTAHGIFHVNFLLKHITKWGDRVFAVSEEVKKYLLENYNLDEKQIHRNINGINLEKFKSTNNLKNSKAVVHVSRLEENTSKVAKLLIQYGRNNRDKKIIIVGGGEELEKLITFADGLDNVILTGKTTDVTEYLKDAKVFVGVGRAALEAMSYGLPTILAGTHGYMGLLNEDNIDLASINNFSARYTEEITYEALNKDLDILLNTTEEIDCSWGREYIEKNYSVRKMVDNYEEVYKYYLGD